MPGGRSKSGVRQYHAGSLKNEKNDDEIKETWLLNKMFIFRLIHFNNKNFITRSNELCRGMTRLSPQVTNPQALRTPKIYPLRVRGACFLAGGALRFFGFWFFLFI